MNKMLRFLFATALLLAASTSHAALVTWTLQDVAFDDAGTASGFFTLDPTQADSVASFDITTTAATTLSDLQYISPDLSAITHAFATFDPNDGGAAVLRFFQRDGLGFRWLRFNFVPTLTASG